MLDYRPSCRQFLAASLLLAVAPPAGVNGNAPAPPPPPGKPSAGPAGPPQVEGEEAAAPPGSGGAKHRKPPHPRHLLRQPPVQRALVCVDFVAACDHFGCAGGTAAGGASGGRPIAWDVSLAMACCMTRC